jgi:hypothetical protein
MKTPLSALTESVSKSNDQKQGAKQILRQPMRVNISWRPRLKGA